MQSVFTPRVSGVNVGQLLGVIENFNEAMSTKRWITISPSITCIEFHATDLKTLSFYATDPFLFRKITTKKSWPDPKRVLRRIFPNLMHHALVADRLKKFRVDYASATKFPTSVYIFSKRIVFIVAGAVIQTVYAYTKYNKKYVGTLRTLQEQVRFYQELKRGKLWIAHA